MNEKHHSLIIHDSNGFIEINGKREYWPTEASAARLQRVIGNTAWEMRQRIQWTIGAPVQYTYLATF